MATYHHVIWAGKYFRGFLGLFNVAHESTRGAMDTNFPRLAQMLIDYDIPVKKMTEEFIPLSKVCN